MAIKKAHIELNSPHSLGMELEALLKSNENLQIFATLAAHDLKSPLQAASSWLSVLSANLKKGCTEEAQKSLDIAKQTLTNSILYINDLLAVSIVNAEVSPSVDVNLRQLVEQVLSIHEREIKRTGASVVLGHLPTIQGNPRLLESVFSNIIRNSLNYRSKNRLNIIEIGSELRPDNFEIFIKDNGIGVSKSNLVSMFKPFERGNTSASISGTGIGLAYCEKIISLYGGKIWAESDGHSGTTLRFTIPKTKTKAMSIYRKQGNESKSKNVYLLSTES